MRRHRDARLNVINAYEGLLVRAYCLGRFWILWQRFLDEIGQYLPARGSGSGSGPRLWPLYYASVRPGLELEGLDLNSRRIAMAQVAARRLGLENVRYRVGNVMDFRGGQLYDAGIHAGHRASQSRARGAALLEEIAKALPPGARLLVKGVDRKPAYKRWFTHALDKLMDPRTPVSYWAAEDLLEEVGFSVYRHLMVVSSPIRTCCMFVSELEEFLPRGRSPPGMTIGRLAILVQLNSRPEIHPMGIIRPRGLTFSPV